MPLLCFRNASCLQSYIQFHSSKVTAIPTGRWETSPPKTPTSPFRVPRHPTRYQGTYCKPKCPSCLIWFVFETFYLDPCSSTRPSKQPPCVFIHEKRNARAWHHADQVRRQPLVEAGKPLVMPDLANHINDSRISARRNCRPLLTICAVDNTTNVSPNGVGRRRMLAAGVLVCLEPGTKYLMGVSEGAGEDFGERRDEEVVCVCEVGCRRRRART